MAEKRNSSEKNNVGKKLVLGLIAVISLPILLVGLAGIIIMHLVQNTALNAGVGTVILIVALAVFVAGSMALPISATFCCTCCVFSACETVLSVMEATSPLT